MNKFKQRVASLLAKRNWNIRVNLLADYSVIEVTDPSFLLVNIEDLLYDVIENAFHGYRFLSISQFVDRDQWDFSKPEDLLERISNNFLFPVVLTKGIESYEEAKASENAFAIHVIYPPEKRWFRELVRFSMTSNPNIIYGLQSKPENWPSEVIQWNMDFRKWFGLESDDYQLVKILKQVNQFAWTEDGHIFIGVNNYNKVDDLLMDMTKLALENSLVQIIKVNDERTKT
jgi:hypothetical protein